MDIQTLHLKYGPMVISVESTNGEFQRVARYSLTGHPKLGNKTLTNRSKFYKTERGAIKEAQRFINSQCLR